MAEHGHRLRLVRVGDDLALLQHDLRVLGQQADQLLAASGAMSGRASERLPTKSGFTSSDRPGQAGVVRVSMPSVSWPTMM